MIPASILGTAISELGREAEVAGEVERATARTILTRGPGGTGRPQGHRPGGDDRPRAHGRARVDGRSSCTGDTNSDAGKRLVLQPAFLRKGLRRHLDWYAEKGSDGLLYVREKGKPFRKSAFVRKWREARVVVGMPEGFLFGDLRHTGHTLARRSGATLKDAMVRAGQSSEKAALSYQRSDLERQQEVASGAA